MYYIDTSVLVAYYCPENLSDQVQSFLGEQIRPAISELTEVELFSAVARKVRMGGITQSDGNRILAKFLSHLNSGLFTSIPVASQHWRIARGWIGLFNTPLRTLDALHLAVASDGDYTLVTSDHHLHQAAQTLGVAVYALGYDDTALRRG